jgi:hypothetical protein
MSDRLKPRSLRELPESKIDSLENRAFAGLKRRQEELEARVRHLREKLDSSTWGKTAAWWRTVSEFLETEHSEALDQFAVPADDTGFGTVGRKEARAVASYLWEQWCSGQDRGVSKMAAGSGGGGGGGGGVGGDVWRLTKPERDSLRAQWNRERLQPRHEELAACLEDLRTAGRQMSDLRLGCQSRILAQARIIGSTTVAAAKLRGVQVDRQCCTSLRLSLHPCSTVVLAYRGVLAPDAARTRACLGTGVCAAHILVLEGPSGMEMLGHRDTRSMYYMGAGLSVLRY